MKVNRILLAIYISPLRGGAGAGAGSGKGNDERKIDTFSIRPLPGSCILWQTGWGIGLEKRPPEPHSYTAAPPDTCSVLLLEQSLRRRTARLDWSLRRRGSIWGPVQVGGSPDNSDGKCVRK